MNQQQLRNICIIAHVDHGKTTLVDHLLRQSGTYRDNQVVQDRVMDSMDLERERGITIMAKNTAIRYKDFKINIVDTPGHADFGGEVERIMGMVDGALLLVDAAEGPLPQTRFVLQKALAKKLRVILVINKVDRPECVDGRRIQEVVNQTFDLFIDLGATEEQLDFPVIYAVAREGWCTLDPTEITDLLQKKKKATLEPAYQVILDQVPPPRPGTETGFQVQVANLGHSDYVGRLAIGRILSGSVKKGQRVIRHGIKADGSPLKEGFNITQLYVYEGLKQIETESIAAGEIGVFAGVENFEIGDTIVADDVTPPLTRIYVEPPTLAMIFSVNTSPMSGKEGEAIQSRKLRERLIREVRHNVAIRFEETPLPDQFRILGRGELQFGVLIEQIRREGYEFMVGRPVVLMKEDESGEKIEPIERVLLDLPEKYVGDVTSLFQTRKGILTHYDTQDSSGAQRVRLEFKIPTRGLLGIRSRYLTATRGEGLFSSELIGYEPFRGEIIHRVNGALVCDRTGKTTEYALMGLEDRGTFFVEPGVECYEGMIVGENNRDQDMNLNPCREKKLTNIRAASAEVLVSLQGVRKMSLEQCIEWIEDDEWIEVTPENVRMRKKLLAQNLRPVGKS